MAHDWFVSEMGRACSFSRASIWHPGFSWAPPSRHIPQCSTTGNRQVTWDLSHTVRSQCVLNVAFVGFQIYGLFDGQTGLYLVVEPDCPSKTTNQGRFWKKKQAHGCLFVCLVSSCACHCLSSVFFFLSDFIASTPHVSPRLEASSWKVVAMMAFVLLRTSITLPVSQQSQHATWPGSSRCVFVETNLGTEYELKYLFLYRIVLFRLVIVSLLIEELRRSPRPGGHHLAPFIHELREDEGSDAHLFPLRFEPQSMDTDWSRPLPQTVKT